MLDYELCRGFAHAVLAATGVWSVQRMSQEPSCALAAIGIHFVVGVVGLLGSLLMKFSNSDLGPKIMDWYRYVYNLALIFALPLMTSQMFMNAGFPFEYCLIPAASAIIPFIYDSVSDNDRGLRDAVIGGNCAALCYLGFVKNNLFAYGMAACFAANYFIVRTKSQISEFQAADVYICLLGLFNYLSIMAL